MGVHLLQILEVRLLLAVHMQKVKTVDDLDQDPLDEDLRHLVASICVFTSTPPPESPPFNFLLRVSF